MNTEGQEKDMPLAEKRISTESPEYGFKGERTKKSLEASRLITMFQKEYYQDLKEKSEQGEPIIWTSVGNCEELFHAMDIPTIFNQHWAALIAAKQMAAHYLDVMNNHGYFRDLCRYCAMPLGYYLDNNPEIAPWGGIAKPTAMVVDTMCDPIIRIWELMAHELDVPLYIWDRPMIGEPPKGTSWCDSLEGIEEEHKRESWRVEHCVEETKGLISFLENETGRTLSEVKLRQTMERSNEQFKYINKAMDLAASVPCPIDIGDQWANMISTQFYRGHEFGVTHAHRLYEEVKERVDNGYAACPNEKLRLMHWSVPSWFSPGFYDSFKEKYGAIFVWSAYLTIPRQLYRLDLSDPLEALARRYVFYAEFSAPPWWPTWFAYYAKKFKADGALFQVADSCRMLSGPIRLMAQALEDLGIPVCEIRSDFVDVRDWDDAKMKSQVSGFIETLL